MTDGRTDGQTDGWTDGGDCNIPDAFLKSVGIMTSPCHISAHSGFSGSLFHVLPILNEVFSAEQEKDSITCVKMG